MLKEIQLPNIKELEMDKGLYYVGGSIEQYLEILQEFGENVPKRIVKIRSFLETRDLKNFVIAVHALKSTAQIIGATALSQMALELEVAGKEDNWDYIDRNTKELLEEYQIIGEELRRHWGKESD